MYYIISYHIIQYSKSSIISFIILFYYYDIALYYIML